MASSGLVCVQKFQGGSGDYAKPLGGAHLYRSLHVYICIYVAI